MKSLMFIPAKDKMLKKLGTFGADAYIIDLEDSIALEDKESALLRTKEFLQSCSAYNNIFVRVNQETAETEIAELSAFSDIGFMLPKFEAPSQYANLGDVLQTHNVIALVETPMGIANLRDIVACSWINAIAFGAEDYTAKVGMQNEDSYLYYPKSSIVTYAKAYGKAAYDTPSFQLNEPAQFEKEVQTSVALGFDGKLLISPKHACYINRQFGGWDIGLMKQIVEQYEKSGDAVAVINGNVYEKMHIERMKRIIRENGGK